MQRSSTTPETAGLTTPEWHEIGKRIAGHRHQVDGQASRQMWAVGDWLLQGEDDVYVNLNRRRVRELAAQITGYSVHTLAMAVSVARRVKPSTRVDGLTWWHHLLVSKLAETEQETWLCGAAEEGWSVKTLRERLRMASIVSRGSNGRHVEKLVSQLTKWKKSEMSELAVSQLRDWWQREMASAVAPAIEGSEDGQTVQGAMPLS